MNLPNTNSPSTDLVPFTDSNISDAKPAPEEPECREPEIENTQKSGNMLQTASGCK